jgi:hypothetical protein
MVARLPIEDAKNSSNTPSDGPRRSDRVQISIPIEAIGTDYQRGWPFCQKGRTLTISQYGAAIVLNYALATDQELTIRCVDTSKEAVARVVGLISGPGKDLVYGVTFLSDGANPWSIEFPTLTGTDEGLVRILLGCCLCQTHKVVHLKSIELQVFEANQSIQQFCKFCSATTSWKRVVNEAQREPRLSRDIRPQESAPQPRLGVDKRKHGRIRSNARACIRQPGFAEEIVTCENLSRGGLRLRTSKPYHEGARIEVALPYLAGSGNIFVPARVIHVQDCGSFFRLGVAYSRTSGKQQASAYSGSASVKDRTNR